MPYTINGSTVESPQDPRLKDGTLWVPLRSLSEALGANVHWDNSTGVAVVRDGARTLTINNENPDIDVDGSIVNLQAAPYVDHGEMWVPVRLFEQALGYQIEADWQQANVTINSEV